MSPFVICSAVIGSFLNSSESDTGVGVVVMLIQLAVVVFATVGGLSRLAQRKYPRVDSTGGTTHRPNRDSGCA